MNYTVFSNTTKLTRCSFIPFRLPTLNWQPCLVWYLFIFTHHLIRQKESHVKNGSEGVHTFFHDKHRPRLSNGSESVIAGTSNGRVARQNRWNWFLPSIFPLLSNPASGALQKPGGWRQRQALSPSLVQGPGWNGEKFNLKKGKKRLPWTAAPPPLSLLHPCLQGQSREAKPKPDGLIGPKDNK